MPTPQFEYLSEDPDLLGCPSFCYTPFSTAAMSYIPPGWTTERLVAATPDELLQLDYLVRLLLS